MLRLVVFLALFAGVVYATFWLLEQRTKRRGAGGGTPLKRGPVGPDDDEDFLRELERRRRHEKRDRGSGRPAGSAPGKAEPTPPATPPPGKDESPQDQPPEEPVKRERAPDEES